MERSMEIRMLADSGDGCPAGHDCAAIIDEIGTDDVIVVVKTMLPGQQAQLGRRIAEDEAVGRIPRRLIEEAYRALHR